MYEAEKVYDDIGVIWWQRGLGVLRSDERDRGDLDIGVKVVPNGTVNVIFIRRLGMGAEGFLHCMYMYM